MQVTSALLRELQHLSVGVCFEHEPLSKYTSLGIGGPADLLVLPNSEEELARLVSFAVKEDIKLWVMGNGTNLLVADKGYKGIVVNLRKIGQIVNEGNIVHCGAGTSLMYLVRRCADLGLSGLEFAAGIPASVGGAAFMNAGAEGSSVGDYILSARYVDRNGNTGSMKASELQFSYRMSAVQQNGVILSEVTFGLKEGNPEDIRSKLYSNLAKRKATQPYANRSAGSYFKNPPGDTAGRLIEAAGCKGLKFGGAQVSNIHANFIVNAGGATAEDVLELANRVQMAVKERFNIVLEPEVRYVC